VWRAHGQADRQREREEGRERERERRERERERKRESSKVTMQDRVEGELWDCLIFFQGFVTTLS